MNANLIKLNNILTSKNIKDNFHNSYSNDIEFKNWLLSILPEIEDCRLQQQNNPWHIYNVLDHTLMSVQSINTLTTNLAPQERLMLSYVMLLHDIGKPATHIVRQNKQGNWIDSFFNHNVVSEKIANRVLPHFNFTQSEQNIIKTLVLDHDFFMHLRQKPNYDLLKSAKNNIEKYNNFGDGEFINQMLICVSLSDNMAQNPQLTPPAIAMLKEYQQVCNSLSQQSNFVK